MLKMQQEKSLFEFFPELKLRKLEISISSEYLEVVNWGDMAPITQLTQ